MKLIHCVDPFQNDATEGALTYFRLHDKGGYHYRYADGELLLVAEKARTRGVPAYVLFNNSSMFDDACRFGELASGGGGGQI